MKKMMLTLPALAAAVFTFTLHAEQIGVVDADAGTYTLTVSAGVTNAITAEDVTAASGYALVKKGAGTLLSGADTAGFAGEIRIEEGILFVNDGGGLGTGAGGTVVSNGAALHVCYGTADALNFASGETISICGEGPDGNGALYVAPGSKGQRMLLKNGGELRLLGDARVGGVTQLGCGKGYCYLDGYTLTVAIGTETGVSNFDFYGCKGVATAGTIDVVRGRLFLDSSTTWAGDSSNKVYVRSGAMLALRGVNNPVPWSLVLEDATQLYPSNGNIWNNQAVNVWSGPVEVQGTCKVEYSGSNNNNTGVTLTGLVSGPGGFTVNADNALRLANPANSFTGGVTVQCNEGNLGGLILEATGALPPMASGSHTVNGGRVVLRGGNMDISNFSFNRGVLSNAVAGTTVNIGTLTKTGNRLLEIAGGVAVTNRLEVRSPSLGTGASGIRLVTDLSSVLAMTYVSAGTNFLASTATATEAKREYKAFFGYQPGASMSDADLKAMADKMLDELPNEIVTSPEFAYRTWAAEEKWHCGAYKGVFSVTGEENVTVTFGISLADVAAVWVDGTLVVRGINSYNIAPAGASSQTCFVHLGEVVLVPGKHELLILLAHYNSSGYGPRGQNNPAYGVVWDSNKAVVWREGSIDPTVATNSADYVKITEATGSLKPERVSSYTVSELAGRRPSFVDMIVPAGTGPIDLGDDLRDMPPYVVANLTGQPFITNGAMKVTNVWTVIASDLAIRPLTLAPGAGLDLSGAMLTVDDYAALNRDDDGVTVVEAANGATLSGLPSLPAERTRFWTISRDTDASGVTRLRLVYRGGIRLFIR